MDDENKIEKSDNSAFNGALQTLERIHELIRHISIYYVNDHWIGLKKNLDELLIEGQGFLTKTEYKKAWADRNALNKLALRIGDRGDVIFDEKLPEALFMFSAWLRYKLHKHKVTMAGKKEIEDGLKRMYSKYKI